MSDKITGTTTISSFAACSVIMRPDYKWKLWVTPPPHGFVIMRVAAPNAFNRKMQEIVFGFKWEKL